MLVLCWLMSYLIVGIFYVAAILFGFSIVYAYFNPDSDDTIAEVGRFLLYPEPVDEETGEI